MIVLDTNVLSELMRPRADRSPAVVAFMSGYRQSDCFIAAVTLAEMLVGVALKPPGRRRDALARSAEMIAGQFADRVLPFDDRAARIYASIWAGRRQRGLHCAALDLQIGAIALASGMSLATRNLSDFAECGLTLVDPWQDTP
ncbi:type II toxin-antitoxin system VapC family toxin [Xanthobacter tagetidis]|uniref:Ribonuclease VapC n=1 Tax=Xanthobacter tagetidis TaxID=60216 RepID=A0A3L7APT6_9HYPH|nr:type II toxin-antitoxin system VapC family toxin [Xanthobacter tagetidis]MBB6308011.1 hypothetical protein [Xanthobacter tagetidis]RLP81651.1 type II toxin-antitoxin system VapC family toxin [Xanthobacter tagetidis]